MGFIGLGYFGVGASDIDAWRHYGSRVLGCEVVDAPEGGIYLRVDSRKWRIAIEPTGEDDITYVGWELDGPTALAEVKQKLEAVGIVCEDDPTLARKRGVVGLVSFVDPFGLKSELFWGATDQFEKPFVSLTGTRGFVTGDQGLGHVVVSTRDPAAMEKFYSEALGFRVSDYIDDPRMGPKRIISVTFMHGNGRHHSLAFAAVPAPKRLLHFMLQTETFDDVGFALDRVAEHGVPLSLSLGRHVNDHMVSFYAWTPSGFEVEYGWGARTVEDGIWSPVRHDRISKWGHHTINPPGSVPNWRPKS